MIHLYQFDWSPFCLVQRRILEFARIPFRIVQVPVNDRAVVWRITRQRYYQVPVLKDGRQVLFEVGPHSQVLAKYLDSKFSLGLFPKEWDGVQELLWRHFEDAVESPAFKLNDVHYLEFVRPSERCGFIRHKERRFGSGCLELWRAQQPQLLAELETALLPAERMLASRSHLLSDRPLFVDFCLFGMLANFLFSGHYSLPESLPHLRAWFSRIASSQLPPSK